LAAETPSIPRNHGEAVQSSTSHDAERDPVVAAKVSKRRWRSYSDDAALVMIDRHVGERLRAIRERQGLSLQALSDRVGIDVARLAAHEAGERIKPEALYAIARTLNVLIAEFFAATKPQDQLLDELAPFASSEKTELLRAWRRLDAEGRHRAITIVQAVAGE
jgi:transcriptional regulator with XRE-family HTH domain